MQTILEAIRTTIALVFLLYASWSDYKTREVSNNVWILFAPPAFTLTFAELFIYEETSTMLFYGICFGIITAFAVILFYSGGLGGADAKALMCLALALPFYPINLLTPLSGDISPISQTFFPITVFSNSVLFAGAMAIWMLSQNIWRKTTGNKLFNEEHKNEPFWMKFLVLITGKKVSINEIKEKWHIYPLEDIEIHENNIKRKLGILPREESRDAIIQRLDKAVNDGIIKEMIWATPGLPMLIFFTTGLIVALFFGDIIWILVSSLLR